MTDSASPDDRSQADSPPLDPNSKEAVMRRPMPDRDRMILRADELPLRERVFGKWAFVITVVPFLIYWGGTMVTSYLETTRKLTPVHAMHSEVIRPVLDGVITKLQPVAPATNASDNATNVAEENRKVSDWRRAHYLDDLSKFMEDEEGDVDELKELTSKIMNEDFTKSISIPQVEAQRRALLALQRYLQHYINLRQRQADNDLDGIRALHEEFEEVEKGFPESGLAGIQFFVGNKSWYPMLYSIAAGATLLAILLAMPSYLKIPFRVNSIAYLVGTVGVVVWIGLWYADKHFLHIAAMFGSSSRAGFNPLAELSATPWWAYTFLAIRFLGLALLIPIAEEFFSRGFLIRYIDDPDWDQVPMGLATIKGAAGMVIYGAVAHPDEIVAAVAWFSMMTWMYLKTRNVWDCVIAHGITNLLLGIFVVLTGTWELW